MLLKNKKNFFALGIFLLCQVVLYYLTLFAGGKVGVISSFCIVALSFAFSLFYINFKDIKVITQIALLFTVFADICLVLIGAISKEVQSLAMIFFNVTQIAYLVRLIEEQENKKINLINLFSRLPIFIIVILIANKVLGGNVDFLAVVSLLYYVNLAVNGVFAFISVKKSPLLALGLLFFLLCDTVVGLSEMARLYLPINEGSLIHSIIYSGFNLAWVFYAPSQVLLSISSKNQPALKKEN